MFDLTPEKRKALAARGKADPVWWMRNVLGRKPWSKQIEIIEAVRDHNEVAVKSCHGAGKDWTAAGVVLWFLMNHKPSIVITTGPTSRQVKGILWKEIRVAHKRAKWPLGGKLLQQELKLADDWWAWGFTAPETDPTRFQGFHEANVLVVVDEAAGVSDEVYTGIEAVLSSDNAKKLEIGNPTDEQTQFGKSFKDPEVKKISIDAFETPNFTKFGIELDDIRDGSWEEKINSKLPNPKLVTPRWVARRFQRWGEDSPLWQSRVRGQFPEQSEDRLIPLSWIEAAQNRELEPIGPHRLGVDVARFGADASVCYEVRGPVARKKWETQGNDTMEVTGKAAATINEVEPEWTGVDVIGIGAGVKDRLKELGHDAREANASKTANEPERFKNCRAEWGWNLRERFDPKLGGQIDIDPDNEDLASELAAIKYKIDSSGKIILEPKEKTKKALGRSPDEYDALAIAYAELEPDEDDWDFA